MDDREEKEETMGIIPLFGRVIPVLLSLLGVSSVVGINGEDSQNGKKKKKEVEEE